MVAPRTREAAKRQTKPLHPTRSTQPPPASIRERDRPGETDSTPGMTSPAACQSRADQRQAFEQLLHLALRMPEQAFQHDLFNQVLQTETENARYPPWPEQS